MLMDKDHFSNDEYTVQPYSPRYVARTECGPRENRCISARTQIFEQVHANKREKDGESAYRLVID